MIKKKDLQGFTYDELTEKLAELTDRRDQIADQIHEAEAITIYDPDWMHRARYALKCTRKDIRVVEDELARVGLEERTRQFDELQEEVQRLRALCRRLATIVGSEVYQAEVEAMSVHKPLEGQTWVVSGKFERFTRDEMKGRLMELGARVAGSVGKHTSRIVAGPGAGSKLIKARELNVPVMNELEFDQFIHFCEVEG